MKLQIKIPPKEIYDAEVLIEKTKEKNNFGFKLTLSLDYKEKNAGIYNHGTELIINPKNCSELNDCDSHPRFILDNSAFGAILHEFIHFLTLKYFKDFMQKYEIQFKEQLILNNYVELFKNDRQEEVAEIGVLYLSNPYLLKLISNEHYFFFRKYFKSPTLCTQRKFMSIYNKFPENIKVVLQKSLKF